MWTLCFDILNNMNTDYQKIIDFMLVSGKRLAARAGNIADIGITKTDLTEEDITIERGFKDIVSGFGVNHIVYGEEENDMFQSAENIWTIDPISGTATFIAGLPHYSIVIAHLIHGETVFAAVYDPSADELFTAYKGKGSFLNNQPIRIDEDNKNVIFRESVEWKEPEITSAVKEKISSYSFEKHSFSMAVDYCSVACGRFGGILSFTKDSFPEFAGGFIIQEAGGTFTNLQGESNIKASDRMFIGGGHKMYSELFDIVKSVVSR